MINRKTLAVLVAVLALGVFAVTAMAVVKYGGGGNDVLDGTDNADYLYGNSGCDDLLGRGGQDHLEGGPSGCDAARGMEGWYDDAIVWDDDKGNDQAYGGTGDFDTCYVGNQDWVDWTSCEIVRTP